MNKSKTLYIGRSFNHGYEIGANKKNFNKIAGFHAGARYLQIEDDTILEDMLKINLNEGDLIKIEVILNNDI